MDLLQKRPLLKPTNQYNQFNEILLLVKYYARITN